VLLFSLSFDPADILPEIYEEVLAEGLKRTCLIPLVNRGRALGILSIARKSEANFTPEDVEFVAQAAGQIAIAIENAIAYHEISQLKDKLAQEKLYLEEEIRSEMNFENIVGNSPALKHVLELVETVAPSRPMPYWPMPPRGTGTAVHIEIDLRRTCFKLGPISRLW